MKDLKQYIIERGPAPKVDPDTLYVIKDLDLDGAIIDVCDDEKSAKETYDMHMKENPGNKLEIVPSKKSEFVKPTATD